MWLGEKSLVQSFGCIGQILDECKRLLTTAHLDLVQIWE